MFIYYNRLHTIHMLSWLKVKQFRRQTMSLCNWREPSLEIESIYTRASGRPYTGQKGLIEQGRCYSTHSFRDRTWSVPFICFSEHVKNGKMWWSKFEQKNKLLLLKTIMNGQMPSESKRNCSHGVNKKHEYSLNLSY